MKKNKVLIVSPQASRVGHGAFHGQRTLQAFARREEWETIFLTGKSFTKRIAGLPIYGEVIEAPIDFGENQTYQGTFDAIKWGIKRRVLQNQLLLSVDEIAKTYSPDVIFMLDGDVFAIYNCYKRVHKKFPKIKWVIAHSTLDFWYTDFSVRSVYKWWASNIVKRMTEEMGSTILFVGPKICDNFCNKLNISSKGREKIVLSNFGCDSEDMRVRKSEARKTLNIPLDVKVALFFGLIRSDKRPEVGIKAVSHGGDNWWLLLAGQPYSFDDQSLRKLVKEAGLEQRSCLLLRYLSEEEIKYVFSASDVLLLPHDRSIVSNSGPLSMARSYRLPVIVNNVGSLGESVLKDGVGLVAELDEPDSFYSQFQKFSSLNSEDIRDMQEKIKLAAFKYSFDATVSDYLFALNMAMS